MTEFPRPAVLLFALAAACGNDGSSTSPDAAIASGPDAAVGSADGDTGARDGGGTSPDGGAQSATVFAVGASESSGVVSTVALPSLAVEQNVVAGAADSDPLAFRIGGEMYIVNRADSNVTILGGANALVDQISTGAGTNPHGVAVKGDTIYVTAYDKTGIVILDAADPDAGVVASIDLSSLDPVDDEPECDALHLVGDILLAACQIHDEAMFPSPRGPGVIAVIDTTDDTLETSFELEKENPFGAFAATDPDSVLGGDLLIPTAGGFDLTGCIERISLDPEPASAGCLVDDADLGGYVSRVEVRGDTVWLSATDPDTFGSFVTSYDASAEAVAGAPLNPDTQSLTDFDLCPTGHIVAADNGSEAARGLRLYQPDGTEVTGDILDIGANPAFQNGLICY